MNASPKQCLVLALGVLATLVLVGCADQVGEEIHRPGMEDPFIVDPSGTGIPPKAPALASGGDKESSPSADPARAVRQPPDPLTTREPDKKSADPRKRMLDDPAKVTTWLRDPTAKRVASEKGRREVEVFTQDPSITAPADPNKLYKRRLRKRVYLEEAKSAAKGRGRLGEEEEVSAEEAPQKTAPGDPDAKDGAYKRRAP